MLFFRVKAIAFRFWLLVCLVHCLATAEGQQMEVSSADTGIVVNYIPKYSWSVAIEHSYVPQIFQEPAQYIPDNFEVQWWMVNRVYGNAGIHVFNATDNKGNLLYDGFAAYAGANFKLFLFRYAYFTPSWSVYAEVPDDEDSGGGFILSTGPTASFEYFIGNRFSMRLDVINISYGYHFTSDEDASGGLLSFYRALGLALRYNFDL